MPRSQTSGGGIYSGPYAMRTYFNATDYNYVYITMADVPIFNSSTSSPSSAPVLSSAHSTGPEAVRLSLTDLGLSEEQVAASTAAAAELTRARVHRVSAQRQRQLDTPAVKDMQTCSLSSFDPRPVRCTVLDAAAADSILRTGGDITLTATNSSLQCSFHFSPAMSAPPAAAVNLTYAVMAIDTVIISPHTPDHLLAQSCLLVRCAAPPLCYPNIWQASTFKGFGSVVVTSPNIKQGTSSGTRQSSLPVCFG